MKSIFLLALLLLCPAVIDGQDLTPAVLAMANRPVLRGTSWAAIAAYPKGEELFSVHSQLRLAPASTLKLLTSAAALETFGPQHRFQTRIYMDGTLSANGTLEGNLYIRGGGDPTLGSKRVQGSLAWQDLLKEWAHKIQTAGIKQINGNIYADETLFEGPSLPTKTNWQNMGNYFAAQASALSFNDNSFEITFFPQSKHGEKMQIKSFYPHTEGLKIRSFVTADSHNPKDEAYVYAAPGQYEMEIYGTLPASLFKDYTILAALPEPAQLLTDLLIEQLEQNQISVQGSGILLQTAPDYPSMSLLHTHFSPPLKDIIYIVNKRSFNLYAEILLRQLAVHAGKKGSTQAGLEELYKFLQNNHIPTDDVLLYDGSGLSRDNQISAQVILSVLNMMTQSPHFEHYYNSLATLDDRADLLLLRRFFAPLQRTKDVHVKGGTLDGVKAQAGYAKDKNGKLIAFVFIANNIIEKGENINRFYEDLLKILMQHPQK